MTIRLKIFIIIFSIFSSTFAFSQTRLDTVIEILRLDSSYSAIRRAKIELQDSGKASIPYLIKLLRDTSTIQVINTADLIYPGAKKFYGHGGVLNYAINSIAARAGWIIEEITFKKFGYEQQTLNDQELIEFHKNNYKKYLEKGYHEVDLEKNSSRVQWKIYRLIIADSVSAWWDHNKNSWTMFSTLKTALSSDDSYTRDRAVEYLLRCSAKNFRSDERAELISLVKKHEIPGSSFHWSKEIFSDGNLVIVGAVYHSIKRTHIENVTVNVFNQDSVLIKTIKTDKDGKYDFALPLYPPDKYLLKFSYPTYCSKQCLINTADIPSKKLQTRLPSLEIILYLAEKVKGVDYSCLDKPLNIYYYNPRRDEFTYDKKYLESILPTLTDLKKTEDAARQK